jgi:hypothetical protein
MHPLTKIMLYVVLFLVACYAAAWYAFPTSSFATPTAQPPQSVVFNPNTCTDIIELPATETIWGDVSNGYKCGHE